MKKEANKTNNENGITLIALVITIIILLILAAVSMATLTGDNGILTKAQEAKEETEKAEIEEQLKIAQLNAKIKKSGGAITIEEYLTEVNKLKESGMNDIVTEYEKSTYETYNADAVVIAKGKYIYGINKTEDGDIKIDYIGNDPKELPPAVEIAKISNTTNSITVEVTTRRNDGGVLEFYLKGKEDTEYSLKNTESGTQTGRQYTYTYDTLVQGETYQIQIIAKAKNGKTTEYSKEIKIGNIEGLIYDEENPTKNNIEVDYTTKAWTPNPVTVTVNTKITGFTMEYAIGDPTVESNWKPYTEGKTFSNNGVIYVRLKDSAKQVGGYATINVKNIDTLPPVAFNKTTLTAESTTNSITVTANTTDQEETNLSGCSGIHEKEGYRFKLGDGDWTSYQADGNYTFDSNLNKDINYTITVEAKDKAGNRTIGTVTAKIKATYTVTYNANGGTGAPNPDTKIEGTDLTLNTTTVPTKEGHVFKGWGTSPNATTAVSTVYTANANTTLYAIWEEKPIIFSKTEVSISGQNTNQYRDSLSANLPANTEIRLYWKSSSSSIGGMVEGAYLNGVKLNHISESESGTGIPRIWVFDTTKGGLFEFKLKLPENAYGQSVGENWRVMGVRSKITGYEYKFK